jgi:DNA phosphorothioation-dependent restriction protein DptH
MAAPPTPRLPGPVTQPFAYHALLGRPERQTTQMGIIGESLDDHNRILAMDLTHMNCIGFFGEPGSGKSYCMGAIIEMGLVRCPGINLLPRPIATVVFHYSGKQSYKPEASSMILANDDGEQIERLRTAYSASPTQVEDCILLAPRDLVNLRQTEFPAIPCHPLSFSTSELQTQHWQLLMGALGDGDSLYVQVINGILKRFRNRITIAELRDGIEASQLAAADKDKARIRIELASHYIDEHSRIIEHLKPGRLILVDLRDEFLQKREALALLIVLLQLFAEATDGGKPMQKLCVFDEAHKYLRDAVLVDVLTETIREMRHQSTSILIASQDPPSVPLTIIELSSLVIMLKMSSPLWLAHIAQVKPAYQHLSPRHLEALMPGEAYVWAKYCSDIAYTQKPHKVRIRPRFSKHGGDSRIPTG